MAAVLDYREFTEAGYRRVLSEAKRRYRFEPFGTDYEEPHVLWRHDVDLSVHRAVRLASIEAEEDVTATYFFWLRSPFYNLFERQMTDLARRIITAHGHRLGLHFDSGFFDAIPSPDDLVAKIAYEAGILSSLLEAPVEAFSFHNPGAVHNDLAFDADRIAGLVNSYGRALRQRYTYVSDANGHWRHGRLLDLLLDGTHERLHVLTHPEWWQAEAMPPRERVVRCAQGRAARVLQDYDEALARMGRENIR
jgi:hypothetical protein